MRSATDLRAALERIDGRGYKAYKDLAGDWGFDRFVLSLDHVQGDPFAAPSRVRILLTPESAGLAPALLGSPARRTGVSCALARRFARAARKRTVRGAGSGKSGEIRMEDPGQKVLPQTAVQLHPDGAVEARFTVGLPANGRRVFARAAVTLLCEAVPDLVSGTLTAEAWDTDDLEAAAAANEDADALRRQLETRDLIAFVADGAVLPRRSGIDQRPLENGAIPFVSPDTLRVELDRPNAGPITGMGLGKGVSLIVGGGYHGKSTLLAGLAHGVYNHCPGDGRECVVSDPALVKVRAEDGRAVSGVDISAFITDLPDGQDTSGFSTPNASGSTSQAAAIAEALEAGARGILIDEDTAATNFMIRDRRMQALVPKSGEPITPFIDRVRELWDSLGVSSVLVLGGSGDYLDVADTVVVMNRYRPADATDEAARVAAAHPTGRQPETPAALGKPAGRAPVPDSIVLSKGRRDVALKVHDPHTLVIGPETIDLSGLDPVLSWAHTNTLGRAIVTLRERFVDGSTGLGDVLDALDRTLASDGLDALETRRTGNLVLPRRFEVAAALNRLRTLRVAPPTAPTPAQTPDT